MNPSETAGTEVPFSIRGQEGIDRMVRQIIQSLIVRGGSLLPLSIFLLTSTWIAPESRMVEMLLGRSSIEKELAQVETRGYYESILDASKLLDRDPSGNLADDTQLPPPGWIPFCAAGLVESEQTYLLWRLRPNLDARWNGTSFHSNSLGYRTPEVTLKKPAHVYRILVFGSSNTMGHGVDDGALYTRLLEQWLMSGLVPGFEWKSSICLSRASRRRVGYSDFVKREGDTRLTGSSLHFPRSRVARQASRASLGPSK